MSYTNVTIPNLYSTRRNLIKKVKQLEFELSLKTDIIEEMDKVLYNIPEAIKDYGYVDLYNDDGKLLCTLVEKSIESKNHDS